MKTKGTLSGVLCAVFFFSVQATEGRAQPVSPSPSQDRAEELWQEVEEALQGQQLGYGEVQRRLDGLSLATSLSTSETKLTASEGTSDERFGGSVAVEGERVVVGVRFDNEKGYDSGVVYVYDYDGSAWRETKITPSDGIAYAFFGGSVAVSGDRIVVGASGDSENGTGSGAAYVYDYDGGIWHETKITPSDADEDDTFGMSVAVDGDRVVVGAGWDESAYVFDYDGVRWRETKLIPDDIDGLDGDFFGVTVAVDGDRIVVGAREDDDNGFDAGAAYVYDYKGSVWHETKITASDADNEDNFGATVALEGDRLVVGAYSDHENGAYSGAAYVYDFNGVSWQETKLTASDGDPDDHFGTSVALEGDRLVIGTYNDEGNGTGAGAVYVYDYDGSLWHETKVTPSDADAGDYFGVSVALSGNHVVVGASHDEANGFQSGSAYVYDFPFSLAFSPKVGPPGYAVTLTGKGFTGATNVRFGTIPAAFTVDSDTRITAIVPQGATDDPVRVETPGNWLSSGNAFDVTSGSERTSGQGSYRYASKAYSFSFSAKYATNFDVGTPGEVALSGSLRVQSKRFFFEASKLDWLQVQGGKCKPCTSWLAGSGRFGGNEGYGFLLAVSDGRPDRLRLKIWDAKTGAIVHDTEPGTEDGAAPKQAITKGRIVVDRGVEGAGKQALAAAAEGHREVPAAYGLSKNYPNPFNPETVLPFELPEATHVTITVYDVLGREVARLVEGMQSAGRHEARWRAEGMATGLYVVRMEAGGQAFTQAVTLMK